MNKLENFNEFVNEAADFNARLSVEKPFNKGKELKAARKFKIQAPIVVTNIDGLIGPDWTDLDITLSNKDSIQYQRKESIKNPSNNIFYLNVVIGGKKYEYTEEDLNMFQTNAGTVVEDLLLLYKKALYNDGDL